MQVCKSYSLEIIGSGRKTFDATIDIYRRAVSFIIGVVDQEWPEIEQLSNAHARLRAVETLIHSTRNNHARYPFDREFYKFPSYLRRAAIEAAIGAVSSWKTNHALWIAGGMKGREPKLAADRHVMPVFYRENMSKAGEKPCTIRLKVYKNRDWVWTEVRLKRTDVLYVEKNCAGFDQSSPTLERKRRKYFIRCCWTASVPLSDAEPKERIICAVDLGLNTDAVCTIMQADGTVTARTFIDSPGEKDHLHKVLGRIRRQAREHGSKSAGGLWAYARRLNENLADRTAKAIVQFAASQGCDCIVFEYLDFRGRRAKGRSKRQKVSMWRRNDIQQKAENKAHWLGIRISHVCAWGTSRLAFDGSGPVSRDPGNRALATFSTGKKYNADLSASCNIGARYFIRELLKPCSATDRSRILAEVPDVGRRTSCTLATLWELSAVI